MCLGYWILSEINKRSAAASLVGTGTGTSTFYNHCFLCRLVVVAGHFFFLLAMKYVDYIHKHTGLTNEMWSKSMHMYYNKKIWWGLNLLKMKK